MASGKPRTKAERAGRAAGDPGAPPAASAGAPGQKAAPPGDPQAGDRDRVRERIVRVMRRKIAQLVKAARDDASSDASQLVEALLLHQMTTMKFREAEVRQVLEEQRKRRELEQKYENEHQKVRVMEGQLEMKKQQLAAARRQVEQAEKAMKKGRPWNTREVVERISAAIGLTGPPQRRAEPEAV